MVNGALQVASPTVAQALLPRSLTEMVDLSERIAKSALIPTALRNKPIEVLMQLTTGHELGIPPMASLRGFYIVDGKVCMAADTMVALVLRSGACRYFQPAEGATEKSVSYITRRGDGPEVRCTWTLEMARTASLHMRDNWRSYPRAMLAARAKAELARSVYPDVLAGIYTPDELGLSDTLEARTCDVPGQGAHATDDARPDQPTLPEPPAPPLVEAYPELAEIERASNVAHLKALAKALTERGIDGDARELALARYRARLDYLRRKGATSESEAS